MYGFKYKYVDKKTKLRSQEKFVQRSTNFNGHFFIAINTWSSFDLSKSNDLEIWF